MLSDDLYAALYPHVRAAGRRFECRFRQLYGVDREDFEQDVWVQVVLNRGKGVTDPALHADWIRRFAMWKVIKFYRDSRSAVLVEIREDDAVGNLDVRRGSLADALASLRGRRAKIAGLYVDGHTPIEIGKRMAMNVWTVKRALANIKQQLRVRMVDRDI